MPVKGGAIAELLLPGLRAIEMRYTSLAQLKQPGSEALQQLGQMAEWPGGLAQSFRQTEDIIQANIFSGETIAYRDPIEDEIVVVRIAAIGARGEGRTPTPEGA